MFKINVAILFDTLPASIKAQLKAVCFVVLLWLSQLSTNAQTVQDSISSSVLKEERKIQVILPENYKNPSEKFDVIYLLDGDWNIGLASEIEHWLNHWQFTPPVIIVAVNNIYINGNNQRGRDLTPTHVNNQPSGGAAAFLSFLKSELIPYINNKYRSTGSNTLFGHSLGGLFTMYALFTEPGLFDSYIAADPSLFWDNGYITTLAGQKLDGIKGIKTLYISGRSGKYYHEMNIDRMDSILRVKAPLTLKWKTVSLFDETHISTQLKSIYEGLKFSYTGYRPDNIIFTPMNGFIKKDAPYLIRYDEAIARAGYTTDGTQPTEASPLMVDTLTLRGDARFTLSTLCYHPAYNKNTAGYFKEGPALQQVSNSNNRFKPGGLHYAYYEGTGDILPAFEQLHALRTGIAGNDIDIDGLQNDKRFALLVTGLVEIKEDGYYTFVMTTDDAATLYIGNQQLIKKQAGQDLSASFMVPLTRGLYPVRMEYLHRQGDYSINLTWFTPRNEDSDPSSIPPMQLYGQN